MTDELNVAQGIEEDGSSSEEDTQQGYDFLDEPTDGEEPAEQLEAGEDSKTVDDAKPAETPPPADAQKASPEVPPASGDVQQETSQPAEVQVQPTEPQTPVPVPEAAPVQPWAERRKEWETKLAAQDYAMSDEEFTAIIQDPKEFANAAARLHMNVVESVVVAIRDVLPHYINTHLQQQQQSTSAETAFYAKWPKLKGQEQLINTYGSAWSKANPNATLDQRIDGIGKLVSMALGHDLNGGKQEPPATTNIPPHVGVSALGGTAAPPRVHDSAEKMWAEVDKELFSDG